MDFCVSGQHNHVERLDLAVCAVERHLRGAFHGYKSILIRAVKETHLLGEISARGKSG